MFEIDWKLALGIVALLGTVLLAAAKSIFVTKSKIYDTKGITIFVPRYELKDIKKAFYNIYEKNICRDKHKMVKDDYDNIVISLNTIKKDIVPRHEWETSYKEREKRRNEDHTRICNKLDVLTDGQREIEKGLSRLYGLLEKRKDEL